MIASLLFALIASAPTAPAPVTLAVPDTGRATFVAARKPGMLRTATRDVPVTLVRFEDESVPFVTYYPERELAPSVTRTSEGTTVRFVPSIRGRRVEGAMATFIFPDGAPSAEALRAATFGPAGLAARSGWAVSDAGVSPCLWAEEGRLVRFAEGRTGFVCVGTYLGTGFRLEVQGPPELADALGARVDVLLEELRWRATGGSLGD